MEGLWDTSLQGRGPRWRGKVGRGKGKARRSLVGSPEEAEPSTVRGGEKEWEGQMDEEEGVCTGMEGQMDRQMGGWMDGWMGVGMK